MKFNCQDSNAYVVVMNGYPDKQKNLNDVLGVILRIGTVQNGKIVVRKGRWEYDRGTGKKRATRNHYR